MCFVEEKDEIESRFQGKKGEQTSWLRFDECSKF